MTQCPVCLREIAAEDAAFCLYCGAELDKRIAVSQEVQHALKEAEKQKDPVKKHQLLLQAQERFPDSLDIARELLFLGRLYERSSKKLDYSVIKCYLWHMYLTPDQFSAETKDAMRAELVSHPLLMRCLELAPDQNDFMRRYLRRLASEFITMFLLGSTYYTKTVFGFRIDNRMGRVLAEPAASVICAIREDEALDEHHRTLMADAFYRAFITETGGESRWLDEWLEKKGHPVPRKG